MKRFWQWLGFHVHDWGKWEKCEYFVFHDMETAILLEEKGRNVSKQRRVCQTCGRIHVTTV